MKKIGILSSIACLTSLYGALYQDACFYREFITVPSAHVRNGVIEREYWFEYDKYGAPRICYQPLRQYNWWQLEEPTIYCTRARSLKTDDQNTNYWYDGNLVLAEHNGKIIIYQAIKTTEKPTGKSILGWYIDGTKRLYVIDTKNQGRKA